jgi:hypothetical protein
MAAKGGEAVENVYWKAFLGFWAAFYFSPRAAPDFARSGCFFSPQRSGAHYCEK